MVQIISTSHPPFLNLPIISYITLSLSSSPLVSEVQLAIHLFKEKITCLHLFHFHHLGDLPNQFNSQSCILDLSFFIGSFTIDCKHAQVLSHIKNNQTINKIKQTRRTKKSYPVSVFILLSLSPLLSALLDCQIYCKNNCLSFLSSYLSPNMTPHSTSLLTMLQIKKLVI